MKKRYIVVTIDSARWTTAKMAVVGIEGDYTWVTDYAKAAFDLACARWHIAREDCKLVDYQLLPDDVLFVNCGDFL